MCVSKKCEEKYTFVTKEQQVHTLEMDHSYGTRRNELTACAATCRVANDVMTILAATPEDRTHITSRKEPCIGDDAVRLAVQRHVGRLGLLPDDLEEQTRLYKEWPRLDASHVRGAWTAFLDPRQTLTEWNSSDLETWRDALKVRHDEIAPEETYSHSSYSDYSESETQSSTGGSGNDDDDEMSDADDGESVREAE